MVHSRETVTELLEKAYKKVQSRQCVGFSVKAAKTGLFDCKMGGIPYFPKDMEYPFCRSKSNSGKPMKLIAQLNFEKIPHIEDFPEKGILQFFTATDDLYGMNFDDLTAQDDFRVIYHENIITDESLLMTAEDIPAFEDDDFYCPLDENDDYLLEPQAAAAVRPKFNDVEFCEIFMEIFHNEYPDSDDEDSYDIEIDGEDDVTADDICCELSGNSLETFIGGFPFFTQSDPRENLSEEENVFDTVLFESMSIYDEDTGVNIMWGDMGTGTFLISRESLKKRDFSKVIYNYDCY